jgi:hypothetical protein
MLFGTAPLRTEQGGQGPDPDFRSARNFGQMLDACAVYPIFAEAVAMNA